MNCTYSVQELNEYLFNYILKSDNFNLKIIDIFESVYDFYILNKLTDKKYFIEIEKIYNKLKKNITFILLKSKINDGQYPYLFTYTPTIDLKSISNHEELIMYENVDETNCHNIIYAVTKLTNTRIGWDSIWLIDLNENKENYKINEEKFMKILKKVIKKHNKKPYQLDEELSYDDYIDL